MTTAAEIDALWNFQQPAETEARFRALLPEARAGEPAILVELLTQIARTQGLQRKFDDAHATLDEAEALLPTVGDAPRPRLRLLLERGRAFNSSGKPDVARAPFVQAYEQGLAAGEEGLAVDAAHMVAIVEKGEASLEWNVLALALARKSEQPAARKWVGSLTNNMGWSYHDLGRHDEALACFEENAAWYEERGAARELAIAKWAIARQLRALGRLDEALAAQRALSPDDGYVQEELGECLLALGRPGEAAPHFAAAHRLLSPDPWLQANEPARLERLKELGAATV